MVEANGLKKGEVGKIHEGWAFTYLKRLELKFSWSYLCEWMGRVDVSGRVLVFDVMWKEDKRFWRTEGQEGVYIPWKREESIRWSHPLRIDQIHLHDSIGYYDAYSTRGWALDQVIYSRQIRLRALSSFGNVEVIAWGEVERRSTSGWALIWL